MYLLICNLEQGVKKEHVEEVLAKEEPVKLLTWLEGKNGLAKKVRETPMIVGSINSLFKYEEQIILLAKIQGKSNVDHVIQNIKSIENVNNNLDYYVVPLCA